MAMRMPSDLGSSGLGSVQRRFTIGNDSETKCSHKNWKNEKKEAVLNSVWLIRKIRISYKYNIINHALNRVDTLILRLHTLWLLFTLNNLLILRQHILWLLFILNNLLILRQHILWLLFILNNLLILRQHILWNKYF